jgi:hypothetical protein
MNLYNTLFLFFNLFICHFLLADASISYHHEEKLNDTLNVKAFGAKGNGTTNDYRAIKKVVELANKNGGGIILFPKGTYYIEEYNDSIDSKKDLKFINCNSVKILGEEAIISLNGNFKRGVDTKRRRISLSSTNQLVPLFFMNCKGVAISGIEVNGNVQQMKRDKGVVEKGSGLITILGCDDIDIKDVTLHHSPSDGIYVGPSRNNSTGLKMTNVKCLNNARQGISITGLRGGYVKSCVFSNTGITGGEYGFHRPAAGVDIEPAKLHGTVKMGDIVFEDCIIENNLGGQFLCTQPRLTSNITLRKCRFTGIDSFSRYQLILAADSVLVEKCEMNLGRGNLFPTWKSAPGSVVRIQDCSIKSSLNGILSSSRHEKDTVYITNNTLTFTGDTLKSYFPYLQSVNLYFTNNKVLIPGKSTKVRSYTSLVQNAMLSKGNKFYSDVSTSTPKVSYQGTKKVED